MAMETQDIVKRSATNPITPAPRARDYKQPDHPESEEVAKENNGYALLRRKLGYTAPARAVPRRWCSLYPAGFRR
jgi:hypothetical protein